jgi:hypothetical protein
MRPPRFSVSALMGVVVWAALGIVMLRFPSSLILNVVFSVALLALLAALLLAIYLRGPRRAFAVGFCVFGLFYLTLTFGPWFSSELSARLVTTTVLDIIYPYLNPAPSAATTTVVTVAPGPSTKMMGMMSMTRAPGGSAMTPMGSGMMASAGMMTAPNPPPSNSAWNYWNDPTNGPVQSAVMQSSDLFRDVGHAEFTLLFALLGGCFVRILHDVRERERESGQQRA